MQQECKLYEFIRNSSYCAGTVIDQEFLPAKKKKPNTGTVMSNNSYAVVQEFAQ